MNENTTFLAPMSEEKRIGNTTFIVNVSFNGDKRHDLFSSIVRLIERDNNFQPVKTPKKDVS